MSERIDKFAAILRDQGVDAFLAQTPITMGYLAGFFEDAHERFLTLAISSSGDVRLICPALSRIQAERIGVKDIRSWRDGEDPLVHFVELAKDWNLESSIIGVDDHLPAKMLLAMQDALPAALFKSGGHLLAMQMGVKTSQELELLAASGKIVDDTYEWVLGEMKAGMTELEVQDLLESKMKERGGVPQFCLVCFGPNAAESHHINDSTVLTENTLVLLDFGCTYQGYFSDITRVCSFGKATEEQKSLYRLVYAAHQKGVERAMAGVTGAEVDDATRSVIVEGGFGEFFTHRTGHGVGMQGHEAPNISSDNDVPLVPGNCFSIEPGIYLPGRFGIRLENLYVATETGVESFNVEIEPEIREVL
jgi:Xaa-Pro dipeptidase